LDRDPLIRAATGDDWKTVKRKSRDALIALVDEKAAAEPWSREVHEDFLEKRYAGVVDGARLLLERVPAPYWSDALRWDLAGALDNTKGYDEALSIYEGFRTGAFGENGRTARAAYRIIVTLARAGRCEESEERETEYRRLYPQLWGAWANDLTKAQAKYCAPVAAK
jgi:hypothetical protein